MVMKKPMKKMRRWTRNRIKRLQGGRKVRQQGVGGDGNKVYIKVDMKLYAKGGCLKCS
jgi:hypothetical protein